MDYLSETRATGRQIFPDLARAAALIGIALVNVGIFAWPAENGGYAAGGLETGLDQGAFFAVNALFLMKSYTLFSFMFGVGFAYQIASAQRAGASFAARYWRRILGLFIFAGINIAFLFQGDILFIYAVLGCLLFLFRNVTGKALIRWAVAIYIVQILVLAVITGFVWLGNTYAPDEMTASIQEMAASGAHALQVYGEGSFAETVKARIAEWSQFVPMMFLFQGIGAMSFFLFGLAAVRMETISRPDVPFWKTCRRIYLPIGLAGSTLGAWYVTSATSMIDTEMMLGLTLISLFSPFSSAGYLGLIARWAEVRAGPVTLFLARGGTASLTAYLLQNLLFTLVFYGFALGYYAQLGAAACIAIALLVALVSIMFTSLWRTVFRRGPLEEVLRGWTYLGLR